MPHDHPHTSQPHTSETRLFFSIALNLLLTVAEVVGGILSGSLSLIADALHNFNDAAALLIALVARRIAKREADDRFTFGYRRAELVGALVNVTALIIVGLFLLWEAVQRFLNPEPIAGLYVVAIAGIALLVDVATAILLWAMSRGNMNIYAAFIHNLTDAAASLAVLIGGVLVWWRGWYWVDPALTAVISFYVLYTCVGLFKRTAAVLMENTPPHIDLDMIRALLLSEPAIVSVDHLHVWELDEDTAALETRLTLVSGMTLEDAQQAKSRLKTRLRQEFDIPHTTIEISPPPQSTSESCA